MFHFVQGMNPYYIAAGLIWAVAIGLSVGNYACSLIFRLPRGLSLLGDKPYCGHCRAPLQVRDLFPLVSALLLHHRCRYCGEPYPTSHSWTEALVALLLCLGFLNLGYSELFFLVSLLGVFLIILSAIEHNEGVVMQSVLVILAVIGMILRTYLDHSIFNFFLGGLYGLLIGMALWRKEVRQVRHVYSFPPRAQLLAAAGICVGGQGLPLFLLLLLVCWLAAKLLRIRAFAVPYSAALLLPLLYPQLTFSALL